MLRITDVLIGNLVKDVTQWDDKESFLTGKKKVHLDKLIQVISSCGVSFSVWENEMLMVKVQEHGTGQASRGMTGVLPSKLEPFIQQDTARTVVELWKVLTLNDISNMKDKHSC